jgi:hypothetical protein
MMRNFLFTAMMCAIFLSTGCVPTKNRVVVLGMIHSGHRTSDVYSLDVLKNAIIEIDPDYVLTEIPPDRLNDAIEQYAATGMIIESRVSRFPEYVDVLFPLTNDPQSNLSFEIIACAGWTRQMADERREKLTQWESERPEQTQEVEDAQHRVELIMEREAGSIGTDHPGFIHTDRYDELVEQALEPYNRLFNDDLGAGGWDNINKAHYALIEKALDEHHGEGKTFLITFGSWHKYWFLQQLRARTDIKIVDPLLFFSTKDP